MTDLPAPLTPADCDLRDFAFMPFEGGRLFGSEFHAMAGDAAWRAGVTLWLKSWHQVPAASLPVDETALARLAELGRDVRTWKKIKAEALHGWVACSDGRLYHRVVAEKALESWLEKLCKRLASGAGNAKRWNGDFNPAEIEQQIDDAADLLRNLAPQSKSLIKSKRRHSQKDSAGTATGIAGGTPRGSAVATPAVIPSGSQETGTGTGTIPLTPKADRPTRPVAERLRRVMEEGRFTSPPNDGALIDEWIGLGADFEQDIIPVVRRVSQRMIDGGRGPFKLKAFDQAIREKLAEDQAYAEESRRSVERIARMDREQAEEHDRRQREDAEWKARNGPKADESREAQA